MSPNKRRVTPGHVEHHGRVSRPRDDTLPRRVTPPTPSRRSSHAPERDAPAASSRYTPKIKSVRFRPGWHKAVGLGFLVLGIAIAVLNEVMLGTSTTLLPGGHMEVYLVLGLVIAGYSTWWFGWFDRER